MYVYIYIFMAMAFSRLGINRYGYQSYLWSASLSPFAWEFGLARHVVRPSYQASARSFSTPRLNHQSSIINHQSGVYSLDSSRFPQRGLFIPSTAIGSVPSLSGQAFENRWRLPPRVRRHRASSPHGSSSNGCYVSR